MAKAWTARDGCRYCNETAISLSGIKDADLPTVLLGIFIEEPTPFLEDFFIKLGELNYPREKLHLFLHNAIEFHNKQVIEFTSNSSAANYASLELADSSVGLTEWQARNKALELCKKLNCQYYLSLDSIARLEEPDTLRALIEANKQVVAPLLSRPGKLWSNFWGSLTQEGFYARSHDYVDLVRGERIGLWNVAHIMNAYLLNGKLITTSNHQLTYLDEIGGLKPVLKFSSQLRRLGIFQHVLNTRDFGHLIDPSTYNTSRINPDFYQLQENTLEWEESYLHENYSNLLEEQNKLEEPCQDVFWFPLVNERFCLQLIEIMENFGIWSAGSNDDPRIEGGYESVPTRDIHFKQVGLHALWQVFLRDYVMPIQLKQYTGYEHDPPRAELAFVVRYHPNEQAYLRPHHDSSTYTLNIALNKPGQDYEGGGCRFIRYNCSVIDSRPGWALIHPGRLTHYHEGLPVTRGVRYIMVTFVDP